MALQDAINSLRHEEQHVSTQLSKIRAAITALGSNIGYIVTGHRGPNRRVPGRPTTTGVRKRRRLSAKARAAISAAQKKRWAKIRSGKR